MSCRYFLKLSSKLSLGSNADCPSTFLAGMSFWIVCLSIQLLATKISSTDIPVDCWSALIRFAWAWEMSLFSRRTRISSSSAFPLSPTLST